MLLKIASRKSDLARLQAYTVAAVLQEKHPDLQVEHLFSASFGDKNPDATLSEMPAKGVFTQDFAEGLLQKEFHMVVHSWKDLPTDMPATSKIFTLPRHDPRDVLIVKKKALKKIQECKSINILTSSPRRVHHIKPFIENYFPIALTAEQVHCHEVRGNIPTRLQKLIDQGGDALLMAKAALDRLLSAEQEEFVPVKNQLRACLDQCQLMVLPLSVFPTAAAQGALAIEALESNTELNKLLSSIHCEQTYEHVMRERDLLRASGGGCHQKLGMTSLPHPFGSFFSVQGITPQGEQVSRLEFTTEHKSPSLFTDDQLYPLLRQQKKPFFKREFFNIAMPEKTHFYVSKETALPSYWDPELQNRSDILLACSGLTTWKKLAKRGLWVVGSSESLGEQYQLGLEHLMGMTLPWLKLTHEDSCVNHLMELFPTYKLIAVPEQERPQLHNKKSFYWMSGSQFKEAIKHYPAIVQGQHVCGPGSTYNEIKQHLSPETPLEIYLNYEQWYQDKTRKN